MRLGLVGRKLGMTRIFTDDGTAVPVTVLDVANNRVTQIKTPETDGYSAVQLAFGKRRASRVTKPMAGHLAKAGVESGELLGISGSPDELAEFKAGASIGAATFTVGELVDVTGTTKGRGFSGVIRGTISAPTAHRTAIRVRTIRRDPSAWRRTRAGCFQASAWRDSYGNVTRTAQLLNVIRVDAERGLLLVKGSCPALTGVNHRPAVREDPVRRREPDHGPQTDRRKGEAAATVAGSGFAVRPRIQRGADPSGRHRLPGQCRQGTRAQKGRADINKSHKNPGRRRAPAARARDRPTARCGAAAARSSRTSPDENFSHKVNRKMYRAGCFDPVAAASRRPFVGNRRPGPRFPENQGLRAEDENFGLPGTVLIVTDKLDENFFLSSRNLPDVLVLETREVDPVSLVRFNHVLSPGPPFRNSRRCWDEPPPSNTIPTSASCAAARAGRVRKGDLLADKHEQVIFKVAPDATKPEVKAAVEAMFKVEVESVQIANVEGQGEALRPIHRRRRRTGRRPTSASRRARKSTSRRRDKPWPLVKVKPTSPGRRALVKVVNPRPAQGSRRWRRSRKQEARSGRNNNGHITMRHKGGGHKQHYRIVDFRRNKDGIAAKVERLEYDPNRSAHSRSCCMSHGERRYIVAPHGVAVGTQLMSGPKPRSSRATACRAQYPGRNDDPLRRDPAGQGRADGALGRRRRAAPRARRHLRAGAVALGRDPQGACGLPRGHRRSRQRRAQPALDRQGRRESLARHSPDGTRHLR